MIIYTYEQLDPIVKGSLSTREVLLKLNIKPGRRVNERIERFFKEFNIDILHFRSDLKYCTYHKIVESLDQFVKNANNKDGLGPICREASKAITKDIYYNKNYKGKKVAYRHGLTVDQYKEMLRVRNNLCDICGNKEIENKKLSIDHDHNCCNSTYSCGRCIRGLLCNKCNRALGMFRDNLMIVKNAVKYLEGLLA